MGTTEGLQALADELDRLDRMGFFVNWRVQFKYTDKIHESFRGKLGKISVYVPYEDQDHATVDLDEGGAVWASIENLEFLERESEAQ